ALMAAICRFASSWLRLAVEREEPAYMRRMCEARTRSGMASTVSDHGACGRRIAPNRGFSEASRRNPMHEYPLLIVESHLDTFGHINHATYLQIFEEARWDLITARGYGLEKIRESRLGPVILEANVR